MKRFFLIFAVFLMFTCICYSSEIVGFKYLPDSSIGALDSIQSYTRNRVTEKMHPANEKMYGQGFVIHNEQEYRDLLYAAPPQIDFTRNVILGRLVMGRCGNKTNFTRTVIRDDSSKQVIYSIKMDYPDGIKIYEPCVLSFEEDTSMNLILVPKIPDGYKVFFQMESNL